MSDALPEIASNPPEVKRRQAPRWSHNQAWRGKWTSEFRAWHGMISRCLYPSIKGYENYGGRGITVCDRWRNSFENFYSDLGPRPSGGYSLERVNNDGNYEPLNCKWATKLEQDNNRRTNVFIEFNGRRLTKSQWAREIGLKPISLYKRFNSGWSIERALTTPLKIPPLIAYKGKQFRRSDLARELGISLQLLDYRIKSGWSEDMLNLPPSLSS